MAFNDLLCAEVTLSKGAECLRKARSEADVRADHAGEVFYVDYPTVELSSVIVLTQYEASHEFAKRVSVLREFRVQLLLARKILRVEL